VYELVGIGNPVYDIIITPRISTESRVLSGCSTNACLAAKKLGLENVGLAGNVGRDFHGMFLADMQKHGVEGFVAEVTEETGGFKLVYDSRGERTLDIIGTAGRINLDKVPTRCLSSRFLLLGPILSEIDLGFVQDLRTRSPAQIFLDPQGMLRHVGDDGRVKHSADPKTIILLLHAVDFVKPNEMEAKVMTGSADPKQNVIALHQFGAPVSIVTLAERGSLIFDGQRLLRIPAFPTEAIDPTGAGDVYGGAFVRELIRTNDLLRAGLFASAAASIMVEHVGPDFPLDEREVESRLKRIETSASVEIPVQ
jgi:sugar/nucleoside kinase (ribokinase family)